MQKIVPYLLILVLIILSRPTRAQFQTFRDSVVQLYGVVMTADSLRGLEAVSIVVKGQNRGTVTNSKGVFSIVVLKGDKVEFSSIGYQNKTVTIPENLTANEYSVIQLMVTDTVYLPATVIRVRPTREQFERDFVNNPVPDDELTVARKNNDEATRRLLMQGLPADGREASNQYFRSYSNKTYYAGQAPPQNIFNPFAWAEFIKAWKRGDFKRKK